MIKMIRNHLLNDKVIQKFVSQDIPNAIFHEFKPAANISNYIIIKDRPLSMGFIQEYQLDVYIYAKDFTQLLEVENNVRAALNDVRGNKIILGDNGKHIKDLSMLIGGGRQYDEQLNRFVSVQYFKVSI